MNSYTPFAANGDMRNTIRLTVNLAGVNPSVYYLCIKWATGGSTTWPSSFLYVDAITQVVPAAVMKWYDQRVALLSANSGMPNLTGDANAVILTTNCSGTSLRFESLPPSFPPYLLSCTSVFMFLTCAVSLVSPPIVASAQVIYRDPARSLATFADLTAISNTELQVCYRFGPGTPYAVASSIQIGNGAICTYAGVGVAASVDGDALTTASFTAPYGMALMTDGSCCDFVHL